MSFHYMSRSYVDPQGPRGPDGNTGSTGRKGDKVRFDWLDFACFVPTCIRGLEVMVG